MMFFKITAPVCGAIVVAGIVTGLVAVAPHQAAAQSTTDATKPAAKPAPKPVAHKPAPVQIGSDYWAVNTNLPSQYTSDRSRQQPARSASTQRPAAASQGVTLETTSEFGRIPVQGAAGSSIGFASGQSASSGRFTDGREVPGLDPNTRSESSFVGLSLSSRSGIPIPVPTPWNRTE
jgi:hypothetical protein